LEVLAARLPYLHPRQGPVTAVASVRATREERRRAFGPGEAARIARALDGALVPAVETGTVLLLRGWGWTRVRERSPLAPVEPLSARARAAGLRAFDLVLREAGSGRPLAGVPLVVEAPDGDERGVTTDGAGRVRIEGLPPGSCLVGSAVEDARVETSYVACAGPAGAGAGAPIRPAHLVQVERHRVRAGETLDGIAATHGVPWERIARFNWGATDPEALEVGYRQTLGCTRRAADGRLRFDDGDDPGILLVPRAWTARLAVGAAHEVFVAPLRPLFLRLENEAGLALPAARYRARFADGSERTGTLGRRGIARLDGVPEGPFTVAYPDELDLLAASLAASVRRALDQAAPAPLFTLLMQSPEVVSRATALYAQHFDDLTGRGLAADIDQMVTDPDARRPLLGLCALAGLKVGGVDAVAVATSGSRRPAAS
jgi:LysM domain